MLFGNKTQIWFTHGPATQNEEILKRMFLEGAYGIRMTFSFSTPEYQIEKTKELKRIAASVGKTAYIVADLMGEKVRLGTFGDLTHFPVKKEDTLTLVPDSGGFNEERKQIPIRSQRFLEETNVGDFVVVGDGAAILKITKKENNRLHCSVEKEGIMNPNRGIVAQSATFQPACLTDKDRKDIVEIAKSNVFDALAPSFVASKEDIEEVRKILLEHNSHIPIIAKIETRKGMENLEEIVAVSDAVMIARGDLALFLPWQELGIHTQRIVDVCNAKKKPWILATQIAEGLERFAFLTRAEICDLTHWTKEGASAVMVSYETAFGPRPVEAIGCIREVLQTCTK